MAHLSTIAAGSFERDPVVISLSDEAKGLIRKYEKGLKERLLADKFKPRYSSVNDILIKKFHLTDVENLEFPDFRNKTDFITEGVRGNIQKSDGNILGYEEGDKLIEEAINLEIP